MQSPKFRFLTKDLSDTFSKKLLRDEWKKRVRYQIRKQAIIDPIEYRDYNDRLEILIVTTRSEVLRGTYQVQKTKRYLIEKSRGLCRQMTLVHPVDLLVLERLSRTVYFELDRSSPSKAAFFEPDDGNFKKNIGQSDFDYGSFASWKRFQKSVFGFAEENRYLIVTDVANFFDFINFQHLRNVISSLCQVREAVLDLLIHVLNNLTWTPDFMPLSQVGMPQIESTATRVLANAMLFEVDRVCESDAHKNYARFMDDMDVGADSIPSAKKVIRDVDLTLQARQLRLNSAKTQILSQEKAFEHFCIKENLKLNNLEELSKNAIFKPRVKRIIESIYRRWLGALPTGAPSESSIFRRGNGSKVHKYCLRLLYECGGAASERELIWLIQNDPGMRSTAFVYLSRSRKNNSNLEKLSRILSSHLFVDDASLISLANYMVHARFRNTPKCMRLVRKIVVELESRSDLGLHCALLVGSRFLHKAELLSLLKRNKEKIQSDFWLSRMAAGIAPRYLGAGHLHAMYLDLIYGLKNENAEAVLNYFFEVMETNSPSQSLKAYLLASNDTYPQGIYYPKVLVARAFLKNSQHSALKANVLTTHPQLSRDPFYSIM